MEHKLKRLDRRLVQEGAVVDFCKDTVRLPDGAVEEWDFIHHRKGGGACIVPVLSDGKILMIRQFRPAIGEETLELPAGARDYADEDGKITAKRELREETGYIAEKLVHLSRIRTAVAWCDEYTDIYLAENLCVKTEQTLDEAEDIRMESVDLQDALDDIFSGKQQDAKTVAGLLAYDAYLRKAR
ncbi:ADP-ribose pyrophosphatase [Lachnospiraceae bacterium]|nr:ADP-ribose pyrophosphatase [Lachnospiraceae bacterium]